MSLRTLAYGILALVLAWLVVMIFMIQTGTSSGGH